jgi:hypothetical protein
LLLPLLLLWLRLLLLLLLLLLLSFITSCITGLCRCVTSSCWIDGLQSWICCLAGRLHDNIRDGLVCCLPVTQEHELLYGCLNALHGLCWCMQAHHEAAADQQRLELVNILHGAPTLHCERHIPLVQAHSRLSQCMPTSGIKLLGSGGSLPARAPQRGGCHSTPQCCNWPFSEASSTTMLQRFGSLMLYHTQGQCLQLSPHIPASNGSQVS